MNVQLTIGDWIRQQADAQSVRHDVFVIEQNIPAALEWDERDAVCVHAVAYDGNGHAIGTGRLLPDGHIGRMAVRRAARGQGIGSAILTALMQQAALRGDKTAILHAQIHAAEFYRRHGFVQIGDEFMEAGIPHIIMERSLAGE